MKTTTCQLYSSTFVKLPKFQKCKLINWQVRINYPHTNCYRSVHKFQTSCARNACSQFIVTSLMALLDLLQGCFNNLVQSRYNKNVTRLTTQHKVVAVYTSCMYRPCWNKIAKQRTQYLYILFRYNWCLFKYIRCNRNYYKGWKTGGLMRRSRWATPNRRFQYLIPVDLSYNDVKCGKIHVTLNMIGSTFFQSQSNFV